MKVYKKIFIKHKNKIISSIFLLAIIVVLTTQVFAYPTTYSIGLDDVLQEQTYWCWAASSVSILSYFGESVTQGSFVTAVTGISPPPNVGASDSQVKSGLATWGVASILTTSYLPFSTIILEIYNYERPIYAGWSLLLISKLK